MAKGLKEAVAAICKLCNNDRTRLMDVVRDIQAKFGCISDEAMDIIAGELGIHRVEVESMASFYAFLSAKPRGRTIIRLCDDIVDEMRGSANVASALSEALGIGFGHTTSDGKITIEYTPCIGMCDQAPAALVNNVVVTGLTPQKAAELVGKLRENTPVSKLTTVCGDGNNANSLVRSMVRNNIHRKGEVIFAPFESGSAVKKTVAKTPEDVIKDIKASRLRGRGGAGFPTGMKWEFTRSAAGEKHYVLCNADEGEPGTFKDRTILTECPDLMFEGMTIAGYAIGSDSGILYLRGEYAYLYAFLNEVLRKRRKAGLLGNNVAGKEGFNFDIRIQLGAGAYVCGEETALISSCEGQRGDPKTRPPFPAQKGYLASPTAVNNVETYCCAARIMDKDPSWFSQMGSKGSAGTKLLSISGDCRQPGVYEAPFGMSIGEMLAMAGAEDAAAVQVGGPSGQMLGPASFNRKIDYDDVATGGSIIIFNKSRDLLKVTRKFMDFFVEESCGYCTPCRVGNYLIRQHLERIIAGQAVARDIDDLKELCETVRAASRCGMGQTSPNPVLSTLREFRSSYDKLLRQADDGMKASFDFASAVAAAEDIAERPSELLKKET